MIFIWICYLNQGSPTPGLQPITGLLLIWNWAMRATGWSMCLRNLLHERQAGPPFVQVELRMSACNSGKGCMHLGPLLMWASSPSHSQPGCPAAKAGDRWFKSHQQLKINVFCLPLLLLPTVHYVCRTRWFRKKIISYHLPLNVILPHMISVFPLVVHFSLQSLPWAAPF